MNKCKYCDIKEQEEAFSGNKVNRGEFLLDDCDVETYIEFDTNEYFLKTECYCGYYHSSKSITFCLMCGRKLN